MKRTLILLALIASLLMTCAFATPEREMGNYYPRAMIVEYLDYENDVVVCIDAVGMEWEFTEIEDWEVGDLVTAIICDNGNDKMSDDYFVDIRWGGVNIPIEIWLAE